MIIMSSLLFHNTNIIIYHVPGELIVTILPTIETEGLSTDDIQDLMDKTQQIMQEEFSKTSAETLPIRVKAD